MRTWDPNWLHAAAFLLPNLLGFLCFTLFPIILSFIMSFHQWTLRPRDEIQFTGLRNFVDLLGVRAVAEPVGALLFAYLLSVLALLVGLVSSLVANAAYWRGTRPGGLLIGLTGLFMILSAVFSSGEFLEFWYSQGAQGIFFGGIFILIYGLATAYREDTAWELGVGIIPGLLLASAVFALWYLSDAMWSTYEPRDSRFWYYLFNTLVLMMGLPVAIVGSLIFALLLNHELPLGLRRIRILGILTCLGMAIFCPLVGIGHGWHNVGLLAAVAWIIAALGFACNIATFRTLFYLPQFTAGVAVFVLWKSLYRPDTGPINIALEAVVDAIGLSLVPPAWLGEVAWAKPAIIFMAVWIMIGGQNMLLYLAALSNVSQDLLDAAEVDGASRWQRFRHVTWQQVAPTTFFITVISIIGGLQGGFEQARVMTEGGPVGSTTTLSYYIYNKMFLDLDLGYAASISWVLFAVIFAATAINWRFGRSQEVDT